MLWEVRHECPSGVWFAFNCYRHWATLVIRAGNGTVHFLHIKEGVNQGNPLTMITYGLGRGTPPLSRTSGWLTPALLSHGMLMILGRAALFQAFNNIWMSWWCKVPHRDIYPDPTKSILAVSPRNVP